MCYDCPYQAFYDYGSIDKTLGRPLYACKYTVNPLCEQIDTDRPYTCNLTPGYLWKEDTETGKEVIDKKFTMGFGGFHIQERDDDKYGFDLRVFDVTQKKIAEVEKVSSAIGNEYFIAGAYDWLLSLTFEDGGAATFKYPAGPDAPVPKVWKSDDWPLCDLGLKPPSKAKTKQSQHDDGWHKYSCGKFCSHHARDGDCGLDIPAADPSLSLDPP